MEPPPPAGSAPGAAAESSTAPRAASTPAPAVEQLNATQREVVAVLGQPRDQRPVFPDDLRGRLHDELTEAIAPFAGVLDPDEPLFVDKRRLSQVHGCEAVFAHEYHTRDFAWSVPVAVGTVAHKAIELSVHWRGSVFPADLTQEAIGRLSADDRGLGAWLRELSEGDRAQLSSDVTDRVSSFQECFPPLKARWRPVTESRVRAEFLGGRVIASGKVDLTLGNPQGQVGGKVILDLKTGRRRAEHRDDLRFYAMLETLKVGTPPRLAASYYLDEGRFVPEDITEAVLDAGAGRFADGVARMVELIHDGDEAVRRPSPACRWCPLEPDCAVGRRYLTGDDDLQGDDLDRDDLQGDDLDRAHTGGGGDEGGPPGGGARMRRDGFDDDRSHLEDIDGF